MAIKSQTRVCSHCGGTGREIDPFLFGQQMRRLRKAASLSLREVARRAGFSAPYISDLEHGRRAWSENAVMKYQEALKQ
jgi:predicted transcriptional regulator